MSLESELVIVLKTLCQEVHGGFAKASTPMPYITFQQIGGQVIVSLKNELGDKENAEMQISVWAGSRSAAKTLIKQIEAALVAAPAITATPLAAPAADFDADMDRHSCRQDFSIWAVR